MYICTYVCNGFIIKIPNEIVEALELSVEMTTAEDFLKFNPPPSLLPGVPRPPTPPPPPSRENFQNPISRGVGGGGDLFLEQPNALCFTPNNTMLTLPLCSTLNRPICENMSTNWESSFNLIKPDQNEM